MIERGDANLMIDNGWIEEDSKNLLRGQIDRKTSFIYKKTNAINYSKKCNETIENYNSWNVTPKN